MRFLRLAPILLLGAACATPAPAPPGGTATPARAAAPSSATETGTFALRQGENTLVTERFTRRAGELEAELTTPNGDRVGITAHFRPDASVAHIEVREFERGAAAGSAPARTSSGTFQGDSVQLSQASGDSTETAGRETVRGTVVYVNPSPSLMEQIVRRARAIGGERVEVPVWLPANGGQNASATVVFMAPDSAELSLATARIRMRTDAQGRLLGGSIPAQGLTIERSTDRRE